MNFQENLFGSSSWSSWCNWDNLKLRLNVLQCILTAFNVILVTPYVVVWRSGAGDALAQCSPEYLYMMYSIVGNFHSRESKVFAEKTFLDYLLVLAGSNMPHPQISRIKLLWIATKPRNLWKFSPSKVSRYTVSLSDVIVFLVSVIAVWHCHGFSSVFCSATYTYHNGLFYVSLYDWCTRTFIFPEWKIITAKQTVWRSGWEKKGDA